MAFDGKDNLYIADAGHQRVRRVDRRSGIITTVVGSGINQFRVGPEKAVLQAKPDFCIF